MLTVYQGLSSVNHIKRQVPIRGEPRRADSTLGAAVTTAWLFPVVAIELGTIKVLRSHAVVNVANNVGRRQLG